MLALYRKFGKVMDWVIIEREGSEGVPIECDKFLS